MPKGPDFIDDPNYLEDLIDKLGYELGEYEKHTKSTGDTAKHVKNDHRRLKESVHGRPVWKYAVVGIACAVSAYMYSNYWHQREQLIENAMNKGHRIVEILTDRPSPLEEQLNMQDKQYNDESEQALSFKVQESAITPEKDVKEIPEKIDMGTAYASVKPADVEIEKTPIAPDNYIYFPVRGDTLFGIARDVTGSGHNWRQIQRYNGIQDHIIEVNQPLKIPTDQVRDSSLLYNGTIDARYYMAQKGDTWRSVSRKIYGNSSQSDRLYQFNRQFNQRLSTRIYNKQYILVPNR